ncbi:transglycosylase SLT domain-containing protein [Achromobacter aloeverae]
MRAFSLAVLLAVLGALAGCATSPPRNPDDICAIFREKDDWYDAAVSTQKKWGVPVQVPFAILYQESGFREDAKPPRDYLLWIIPWGRVSSAYGYAQAKDEAWDDYVRENSRWFAHRDDFGDALDFMGWYIAKTRRLNGVATSDAYGQYLNYHEGWGGYRAGTYRKKAWLMATSRKVQARAERYRAQYAACKKDLDRGFWDFLF